MPFRIYKGGRRPPHPDETHPRLWADDFLPRDRTALLAPTRELTADWRGGIPDDGWGLALNDRLGDCGIAGMDHWQMSVSACDNGSYASWGDTVNLDLYELLGHYVLGDPSTDGGTVLQDNLRFWQHNPIKGVELLAYAAVRPGSWSRAVRVALMRMFGPLYLGSSIQEAQEEQAQERKPWQWEPDSDIAGGHCYVQVAELAAVNEIRDVSWGQALPATNEFCWDALAQPGGEMWVLLTEESVDRAGWNPYGYDLKQMNDTLATMTRRFNPLRLSNIIS